MKRFPWAILCGFVPLLILGYPLVLGAIAYGILRWFCVESRGHIAIGIGYFSLVLLPCYMLGNAWLASLRHKGHQSDEMVFQTELTKSEIIEIWKTCQNVQMHFNGIELQIRNYAVTLLVAVIGAAAYALKEHLEITLAGHNFSMAVAILPAGVLGWFAFYFMDRHWYHRLLLGAVRHTLKIERKIHPELELSGAIGKESPVPLGKVSVHSTEKIDVFYAAGLTFFIILIGIVLAAGK